MSSYGGFRGGGRGRGISFNLQGVKKDIRGVNIPPPPEKGVSKHGYSTLTAISQAAIATSWSAQNKQRAKTEDDYFNDDDEDSSANQPSLAYQPAPGSPGAEFDSDSDDPLDAFMADIEKEAKGSATKKKNARNQKGQKDLKGVRDDIEDEDDEESYYRFIAENPQGAAQDDSDLELEYDEDGNPIAPPKSKHIDPLPPIDHSTITYAEFTKNFYVEHSDIATLDEAKVDELRKTSGIKVTGVAPPKPVTSFAHFGFDEGLMRSIRKLEYTQPTPIQAQAVPAALSGRDVLGLAKTGSGKTAAFLWPMITHIMDQPSLKPGEGPIGLILAPTRELAQQIYNEAKKFGKVYNLRVVCCYGGGSKWEQCKALEEGAEIIVATPGRMIDVLKAKATNLQRTTILVLDEADRMFDMGFEPQVRSICDHIRPDRQTLLFSATFKKKVERLARDVLSDPIRIVQGDVGEANADVTQLVMMFPTPQAKFVWLYSRLVELCATGSVLIFVTKKANAEELCANLKAREYPALLLHGDMDQAERNKVITAFKKRESDILVATDVAARGLDIPHIRTVVNYDVARDIDTHTHRIGRTGRAGQKGTAYTLVMSGDKEFAGHLVRNLEGANQEVPKELMDLAMQSAWFRKSRFSGGKGRAPNVGGKGLGYTGNANPQSAQSSSSSYGANSGQGKSLGSSVGSSGQTRLATLKSAYLSQYKNMFCSASSTANAVTSNNTGSTSAPPAPPTAETGSDRPRKKSRWE